MSDMSEIRWIASQGIVVSFPDAELAYRRERFNPRHTELVRNPRHVRSAYRRIRGIARHDSGGLA